MAVLLSTRGLGVSFGATVALTDIDLDLQGGEVHAVVGENGAGKSTLMRCLAGTLTASSGAIDRAADTQVAWVPQEPVLPADLTVREWIFLGEELRSPLRRLRKQAMDASARTALRALGATFSVARRLGVLSAAQRKQVQLARALRQAAQVLLLDEPTAVLGAKETDALFATIRGLREGGGAVLYVSHRLEEVRAIADRVTVLRDGHLVATSAASAVDTATLVERMVGRAIPPRRKVQRELGEVLLEVREFSVAHVEAVSLSVRAGEIVGLAGLLGAGRSEILEAIAGITRSRAGYVTHADPLAFVPEDRGVKGLVPQFDLRSNIFLPAKTGILLHAIERREAAGWMQRLQIRAAGVDAPITSLSGGNQQKVLLARALKKAPRLLLLDEPTAGVDVGAKAQIHDWIIKLADGGAAIVIASSDMPELLSLCDRILAVRAGKVVRSFDARSASEEQLAASITGAA